MATDTRASRRRVEGEEEEERIDRISGLPDGVLGDIVFFLPTKDGARTQILSSRWRPIWRSAPLNLDLDEDTWIRGSAADIISRILSAHQGPGRRFCTELQHLDRGDRFAALDGWLRSHALDDLQELKLDLAFHHEDPPPPPLPASVHRFSSTLLAASFGGCTFPEGNGASSLNLPLLKQLSLLDVRISETSLHTLLATCPALQSLLLSYSIGCSRVHIVSQSLRSIGLRYSYSIHGKLQQLIIQDAPCLERLLCLETIRDTKVTVSVVSAPKLRVLALARLCNLGCDDGSTTFQFGYTAVQRSCILSLTLVVHSMRILAFTQQHLCLDTVLNLLKCFPCLEKLYIETYEVGKKNTWCRQYKDLIGTLEIRLKKIVLTNYRGNTSHVNFAKFFVLNARMLQSLRLVLLAGPTPSSAWIERQHGLLQIKNKASTDAKFDFVARDDLVRRPCRSLNLRSAKQVHDFSTADPFLRFRNRI